MMSRDGGDCLKLHIIGITVSLANFDGYLDRVLCDSVENSFVRIEQLVLSVVEEYCK